MAVKWILSEVSAGVWKWLQFIGGFFQLCDDPPCDADCTTGCPVEPCSACDPPSITRKFCSLSFGGITVPAEYIEPGGASLPILTWNGTDDAVNGRSFLAQQASGCVWGYLANDTLSCPRVNNDQDGSVYVRATISQWLSAGTYYREIEYSQVMWGGTTVRLFYSYETSATPFICTGSEAVSNQNDIADTTGYGRGGLIISGTGGSCTVDFDISVVDCCPKDCGTITFKLRINETPSYEVDIPVVVYSPDDSGYGGCAGAGWGAYGHILWGGMLVLEPGTGWSFKVSKTIIAEDGTVAVECCAFEISQSYLGCPTATGWSLATTSTGEACVDATLISVTPSPKFNCNGCKGGCCNCEDYLTIELSNHDTVGDPNLFCFTRIKQFGCYYVGEGIIGCNLKDPRLLPAPIGTAAEVIGPFWNGVVYCGFNQSGERVFKADIALRVLTSLGALLHSWVGHFEALVEEEDCPETPAASAWELVDVYEDSDQKSLVDYPIYVSNTSGGPDACPDWDFSCFDYVSLSEAAAANSGDFTCPSPHAWDVRVPLTGLIPCDTDTTTIPSPVDIVGVNCTDFFQATTSGDITVTIYTLNAGGDDVAFDGYGLEVYDEVNTILLWRGYLGAATPIGDFTRLCGAAGGCTENEGVSTITTTLTPP